jgi:hypothetical protein
MARDAWHCWLGGISDDRDNRTHEAGMQRVLDGSLVSWLNHPRSAAEAAG